MTAERADWLSAVDGSLQGARRRRRRLLTELEGHLEDATVEELAAGSSLAEAEAAAVRRIGAPATVAANWNADVAARRSAARLRVVAVAVLVAALAAPVALAQRSGGAQHRPHKLRPATVRPERAGAPGPAS